MVFLIAHLWRHINMRRRFQFLFLLILMLLASFAEMLSIGAVLPFLGLLMAPEKIYANSQIRLLIQSFGYEESSQLLLLFTILFCFAVLTASAFRLLLLWAITRLSFSVGADLSGEIYRRTLYQSYSVHCSRNSSAIVSGITNKANAVIERIILPALMLISSLTMAVIILFSLMVIEPLVALSVFLGLGLIYLLIMVFTRKNLLFDGKQVAHESSRVMKSIQEGLGGIRDVLIDGTQEIYCDIYKEADLSLRRAQARIAFISSSPRTFMEALGMMLIVLSALYLGNQVDGIAKAIPILGMLTFGAQKLLPLLQQSYSSWTIIQGARSSLEDSLDLLDQPLPNSIKGLSKEKLPFDKSIRLSDMSFSYSRGGPLILENVNLLVKKGQRVGFIGSTGSGKSTLIDIMMGLLEPTKGVLEIDDEVVTMQNINGWQKNIAHVPQSIFLADTSIRSNIALGVPVDKIDHLRLQLAAEQAQLLETIEKLPEGFDTTVGERGVRLSGGQRQRIGIARALYKRAELIVLDEATSALDGVTEEAVMNAIKKIGRDVTVFIVAHRITTLKDCDFIVELSANRDIKFKTYSDIDR